MSRLEGRVKATFTTAVRAQGDEPQMTITTTKPDREDDIVEASGGKFANYLRNPVVLFGHDHSNLPIGATTDIVVGKDSIDVRWRWLENDKRAARVRNAFEQGVLRAASIGFIPLQYEPLDRNGRGYRFTEWELLEWSLCPVPANPEAVRVLRSLGLAEGADRADLRRAARLMKRFRSVDAGLSSAERKHLHEAQRHLSIALHGDDVRTRSSRRDDLIEVVNDDTVDVDVRDLQTAVREAARSAAADLMLRLIGRVDLED